MLWELRPMNANINIPDGWSVKKLGDCCSMSSGGTPSKSNSDFWNGDIPWISASAMRGIYFSSSEEKITELGLQKGSRSVNKGDLLLLVRGSMLWNYIPIGIATRKLAFNQDVKGISVKNNITNQFLLYWFKTNEHLIKNMVVGTGIGAGKLDTQELNNIKILLPPLAEQEKIAEILSCWDEGIEKLSVLIDAKKKCKKALMQQLLTGKHRLSGFTDKWKTINLGDICKITTGKLDANAMVENGKYVFFTCARETFLIDTFAFDEEALLISGNGANVGYIHYYNGKFNAYQRTYVLTNFTQNIFFIQDLLDQFLSIRIDKEKKAGNTPYIVLDTLAKMHLFVPSSLSEQQAIADILSKADEEIDLLNKKLALFKEQKKALMQQLLTGKIRVKVN